MAATQPTPHPLTRVLAFSVLIGACLVLILCLAGIIGVWVANTPVTEAILDTVRPLISALESAQAAMENVNQGMSSVTGLVSGLEELLDSAGVIKNLLPGVAEGVENFSASLDGLQTTLEESGGKVVKARGLLETVEVSVARWVDTLSILVTVMLLWLAFSQASLFIHGWRYATGVDLLEKRGLPAAGSGVNIIETAAGSQPVAQRSEEEKS
jgi:hypothetical protein